VPRRLLAVVVHCFWPSAGEARKCSFAGLSHPNRARAGSERGLVVPAGRRRRRTYVVIAHRFGHAALNGGRRAPPGAADCIGGNPLSTAPTTLHNPIRAYRTVIRTLSDDNCIKRLSSPEPMTWRLVTRCRDAMPRFGDGLASRSRAVTHDWCRPTVCSRAGARYPVRSSRAPDKSWPVPDPPGSAVTYPICSHRSRRLTRHPASRMETEI